MRYDINGGLSMCQKRNQLVEPELVKPKLVEVELV